MSINATVKYQFFFVLLIYFLQLSSTARAHLKLPKLIADGMVLQRDTEVKIWGWSDPNEKVAVRFIGKIYQTRGSDAGEWEIKISNLQAGGPHQMDIYANDTIIIQDVLVGDVWVCSGQSNMELNLQRARPLYENEIANCENSNIRYFEVPKRYNFKAPQKDLPGGKWISPNPESILSISAVSYFFGLELYKKYHIPIGLINSALGGSPIEAWISEDAIKSFPEHYKEAQRFKNGELINQIEADDTKRAARWYSTLNIEDKGYKSNPSWRNPEVDITDWSTITIPGYWSERDIGNLNGVIWFRKDMQLPPFMIGKRVKLLLGRIVDADSVFVNGQFIGTTGYQYPPRRYEIPPGILKDGRNTIVIRVISTIGNGGFVSDKPYELRAGDETIDLKGEWKYKIGAIMPPLEPQTFVRWKPIGLYNAMMAPLLNFPVKGVIWYQGESNADRPQEYTTLFPAMIHNWREKWQNPDLPFLFVQLPNFMEAKNEPSESNWALLREAQLHAISIPHTGIAVTIDIGEWNDIHPLNKKDVGYRLALAAQKVAYGEDIIYSGPIYQSMKIKGNEAVISFSNTGKGLMAKDNGELSNFSIAGPDKKFFWAKAKIEGDQIIVRNKKVKNPVAVRYAWADNPEGANLYNSAGLPASPFRTDNW